MGKKQRVISQRFMTWVTSWLMSPSNEKENTKKRADCVRRNMCNMMRVSCHQKQGNKAF